MKKNIAIALLLIALLGNTWLTFTARAKPISEFTPAQVEEIHSLWVADWVTYFGSNMSIETIPETGVMRGGSGEVKVKQITVQGDGNESVVITPQGITCLDTNHQPRLCQISLQ